MKLLSVTRTDKFRGLTNSFSVFEMSDNDLSRYPINHLLERIDTEKYNFYPKRYFAAPCELLEEPLREIARTSQAAINYAFFLMSCCGATYFIDPEKYRFSAFADTPEEALEESMRLVEEFYNSNYNSNEDKRRRNDLLK